MLEIQQTGKRCNIINNLTNRVDIMPKEHKTYLTIELNFKITFKDKSEYSDMDILRNVKSSEIRSIICSGLDMDIIDHITIWDECGNEY